jgi:hypothetical protein
MTCPAKKLADKIDLHIKLGENSPGFALTDDDMKLIVATMRETIALRSRLEAVDAEIERLRAEANKHAAASAEDDSETGSEERMLHRERVAVYVACILAIQKALNGGAS